MVRYIPRIPRYTPYFIAAFIVCSTPLCLAHALETQMPPLLQARVDDKERQATGQNTTGQHISAGEALGKLLKQYQEIAGNGGWPQWKMDKKARAIHVGVSDARMPGLRQELIIMGDYKAASGISTNSLIYDDTLVEAVKHFQARHGLNVDGSLGKSTQAALAVPVEKRITQILATLSRMHERPEPTDQKYILVNLPAFTLYAYDNGKEALTMRVIIGNRANHTPLFDNEVTDVVFNPPWHVPVRIARNELIPKLRENPSYFINAGFVVTQDGEEVDPTQVRADSDDIAFRQKPGTVNALGKIKFNIPDEYDVYLHDTATRKLFANEDRALSHGCIRLQKPRELAYFVMGSEAGWDTKKIDHAYDASTQRSVRVSHVPVHLVYWTAYVDQDGTAHFYNDVYNKDKAAETADAGTLMVAVK